MAYATVDDITSEFKNINFADASAIVVTAEVEAFRDQEEAIINASIENRYVVPVTDTESLLILKKISIAYVAYRIAKIINLKQDIPLPDSDQNQDLNYGTSFRIARKDLLNITTGKVVLNDATARSTEQGVKSYNASNNILPLFERDTKQW